VVFKKPVQLSNLVAVRKGNTFKPLLLLYEAVDNCACKPKIETIEFALKRKNGTSTEDIALGTNQLTEKQKEYLKKLGSFGTPFDIVKEK
jgi:hypothetical protein